jgi:hypothetical protein
VFFQIKENKLSCLFGYFTEVLKVVNEELEVCWFEGVFRKFGKFIKKIIINILKKKLQKLKNFIKRNVQNKR